MSNFVHLHNHTEYSLLDGLAKIPDFVAKAKALNMPALALTDHGVMHGTIPFYLECKKQGVKPIIGCEIYVASRGRFDKDPNKDRFSSHLVLLAKNKKGYKNLIQLVTQAHLDGFYYKPRIDKQILEKYHEGLIALSACLSGVIAKPLMQEQYDEAEEEGLYYKNLFGDDFFIEIQKHRMEEQDIGNKRLIDLAKKLDLPLVATNDIHYLEPEDAEAQEVLLCIQTQTTLDDKERKMTMINVPDFYFRTQTEMELLFHEYPEAIENTFKIAERCNLEIDIGKPVMPEYPIPEGETFGSFLRNKTYEGGKERFGEMTKEIEERIDYELEVIDKKGYSAYFLIVSDFVTWAKDQKIAVGPGRGSAAGSLVSYCMRITDVNPLQYNIPFERFLSPERPSPPDIDMDFEDVRRDEVIEYISEKYGRDHVAQVITFGKMESRAAVRDVGRVLDFSYAETDQIAKLIPQGMSLEEALGQVSELRDLTNDLRVSRLIRLAKKLEGVSRHASTHAAALILADKPIVNYCPLTRESKGEKIITQYDMYSLDLNVSEKAIGLMKFDMLGLRNLTTISRCLQLVKYNKGKEINILDIPMDDPKVFKLIASGQTMGIFQMESSGMQRVARDLKPNRFMDVAALIALYRPGPMELIPQFVESKHDASKVHYPHPDLEEILQESYGIPLYQEQVMLIASKMGGYSLGEADKLRKAMGKKKIEIMKKERKKFIKGAMKIGYKEKKAEEVFDMMERFAGYGFGKAHSVSYAMITYQTAWLKTYYPIEFMAALMTAESHNKDKLALLVNECKEMGIEVLPPDVNFSFKRFAIEGKAIRFGLSGIKGAGEGAIESIIEARQAGKYKSLNDFSSRADAKAVNKRVMESLIKSGACDEFGSRAAQMKILEQILISAQNDRKQKSSGMMGLFEGVEENVGIDEIPLPEIEEFDRRQLLAWEKELMGVYLSDHPLRNILPELRQKRSHQIAELNEEEFVQKRVLVGGLIIGLRKIFTRKNNNEMAFVKIEDETGMIELIVFPKIFEESKQLWQEDQIVVVKGKVDSKDGSLKILVDEAKLFSEAPNLEDIEKDLAEGENKKDKVKKEKKKEEEEKESEREVFEIKIPEGFSREKLAELYQVLKKYPGPISCYLVVNQDGEERKMKLAMGIERGEELEEEILKLIGNGLD